uniref:serine/threonine-protein kinase n=1 Tax=Geodermatophilus chilensis TaxID=2035835 RepID=UPI00130013EE
MDHHDLLDEVRAALGTSELTPLLSGGQKLVYRGQLESVPVAVKIVQVPETAHAEQVIERARREVELLSTVESPFVVRVLSEAVEIGDRPEAVCWVEELLDGHDMRDLIGEFPWAPAQVWSLVVDTASGLAACHELDVVHRDLSPGNVRQRASGRFVLMDPGFARHLTKTALTGEYQPGTPGYLSPEHVPGGSPTPASDMFGLGILAFQALTGGLPVVPSGDDAQYFEQLRTGQAPMVQSQRPDVPDDLAALKILKGGGYRKGPNSSPVLARKPTRSPGRYCIR